MTSLFDLGGKCAVVTGASKGLGRAIALALAEAGADIAGVDRTPEDETAEAVRKLGRRFHVIEADLSTAEPIPGIVEEAERWHANLVIVGCHGYGPLRRLLLGSVSQAVLTKASCSVEVARFHEPGEAGYSRSTL